jgi:membrane protein required for colicin V production
VILDLVLLILLLLAALNGWRSGAMSMLLAIVVLAAALLAGAALGSKVGDMLHVGPDWLRPIIGFLFTFVVVMFLGSWIKRVVRPAHGLLRGLDGAAGLVLGLIRGAVVLSLLLAMFKFIHFPPEHWTENSRLYPKFVNASGWLTGELTHYSGQPKP